MSTVQEIKQAIEKLSISERAELERWWHGWEDDEWDRQIADEVSAGRFDSLLRRAFHFKELAKDLGPFALHRHTALWCPGVMT